MTTQMHAFAAALAVSVSVASAAELLNDPGFSSGDAAWGRFGNVDFNDFFGGDRHASLFADGQGNFGGVFQLGLQATGGTTYRFALTNVRIEQNFNANFRFGLEFYLADDSTKVGEQFAVIDSAAANDGLVTGDGLSYSVDITAPAAAAIVRPIFLFSDSAPTSSSQANAFVFAASLTVVPAPAAASLGLAAAGVAAARRRRR